MDKDQIKEITDSISKSVHEVLNGSGIEVLRQEFKDYVKGDMQWKKTAQPAIDLGNRAREVSTTTLWFSGVVITIYSAYTILVNFFKK